MSSDHLEEPAETEGPEMPAHRGPTDGWHWRLIFAMILGAILVLLALIVLALYGADRDDKAKASEQTLGELASQVQAACAANPADARKVFGDVCGKAKEIDQRPVGEKGDPGAKGDPGIQGPPGKPGPPPSAAQVAAAVSSYCAGGRCAGQGPSVAQVASAVAAYCNARGECQGPTGTAGQPGVQGSPGVAGPQGEQGIQGPPGEPATSEQIAAAVSTYCGQDSEPCKGKDGAPGAPGTPGRDTTAEKCAAANGSLQQITVRTGDPLQTADILVCVLK